MVIWFAYFNMGIGFPQLLGKINTHTCMCKIFLGTVILCIHQSPVMGTTITPHSPIEQYVIDTVKRMRTEKGISQRELAYMMDVSIGFIGDVENPKYRAKYNLNHINELAKIFDCSPRDFLPDKAI